MAPDLLADLTDAQREAVTHLNGPLLILAGAGSGKTRVITRRVAWLLQQGVHPANVLAITFTNKAAGEMRQRVEALVPGCRVWVSTFHSFGARLLRQYADRVGLDRNFTIYDQADRAKVVKMAVEDLGAEKTRFTPDTLAGAISKAKNKLLSPERYARTAGDFFAQVVAEVYPIYEKRLRDANALDFDDLLYWPALALRNLPDLREELDARFRYVLIDEYQDTNMAQYAIARGLSVDRPNLCVVGDPNQSIYAFRGSDITNILNFERDFPDARVLTLGKNYRSTKAILRAAGTMIRRNTQRKDLELTTDNPEGEPVTLLTFESSQEEADGIAKRVRAAVDAKQYAYRDIAVFVRVNALTRALELAFTKHRVPYHIVKGLAFFERKENKDVLAYLRLLLNPRDDLAFLRVVNEPARGIGPTSLKHLREHAAPRELGLLAAAADAKRIKALKGKAGKALADFAAMIADLQGVLDATPDEVIRQVLDKTGYREMLKTSKDADDEDRLANVEELVTAAAQFTGEDGTRTIGDFLESVSLASDLDGWNEQDDKVSVMTLHASKGLEFPVVFIAAVEQGLLPHERSLGAQAEVEEERRLAFVGMTRAKQELYLCHARIRDFRGQSLYAVPSMFLGELPADEIRHLDQASRGADALDGWRSGGFAAYEGWDEAGVTPIPLPVPSRPRAGGGDPDRYREGLFVKHPQYGPGRIIEVGGGGVLRKVRIRFAKAGERVFIADKVNLEIMPDPED